MDTRFYDGDIEEFDFTDFFTVPVMTYCVDCDRDLMSSVWTNHITGQDFHECTVCGMSVTPITELMG